MSLHTLPLPASPGGLISVGLGQAPSLPGFRLLVSALYEGHCHTLGPTS